jgi:hypothetical protein
MSVHYDWEQSEGLGLVVQTTTRVLEGAIRLFDKTPPHPVCGGVFSLLCEERLSSDAVQP